LNVILISLDTTRADHLGCYGYARDTSPNLDAIAAQGALAEWCISPHIPTHPAHTTLFTGQDVWRHRILQQGAGTELDPSVPTLTELLRDRGYYTAAADNLGRWFARGFDSYEGYSWPMEPGKPWRKAEAVNATALQQVERCARQSHPFFLFLHYWDPHTPYLPPPPFDTRFYSGDGKDPANHSMDAAMSEPAFRAYFQQWMPGVTDVEFPKARYDAEIAYMDSCLGDLFAAVERLGLVDETVLAITADHGEELDEHQLWFDHHGLYDTNLRIPLILRCPALIPPGTRLGGQIQMPDVAPTLLDLVGLAKIADETGMVGQSLAPALRDGRPLPSRPAFLTESTWERKRGVRTEEWKLIRALEDPFGKPPVELFSLKDDPRELNNLANRYPDKVAELTALLDEHLRLRTTQTGQPDPLETSELSMRQIG
jgi:arylsulfatase A-like enzyme